MALLIKSIHCLDDLRFLFERRIVIFRCAKFFCMVTMMLLSGCAENINYWPKMAKADLDFIKKTIEENHPGYLDRDNPDFKVRFNKSYQVAMDQLKYVESVDALFNLEREFIASFADVHFTLQFRFESLSKAWAGIKIERRNGKYIVTKTATEWPTELPEIGTVLVSCDGIDVEKAMANDVLRFRFANYTDEYPKYKYASKLLVDDRVGFRPRYKECVFNNDQAEQSYQLVWQQYDRLSNGWDAEIAQQDNFSIEQVSDLLSWVRIPNFDYSGSFETELNNLIDSLSHTKWDQGKTIVFDVRGNGGGNSVYGIEIVQAVYGKENFAALLSQAKINEQNLAMWRVSEGNLVSVKQRLTHINDENKAMMEYLHSLIERMELAQKNGENYAIQPPHDVGIDIPEKVGDLDGIIESIPSILVLTDYFCASSCLDFIKLLNVMPKTRHIGLTTSADTQYNESRLLELPSKLGFINVPQKILVPRGPFQPIEVFNGDITSIDQLKKWCTQILQ